MVSAVISEFNPFHKGHEYLTNQAKKITGCDTMLTIMSGNYVQRGEPAIFDKYTRAKIALLSGYDICLEIPVYAVLSSAQFYAYNTVRILDRLGIVDNLCFGCENDDISVLTEIADILCDEPHEFKELLKDYISNGKSYAAAVGMALEKYSSNKSFADIIGLPNNILAIEYIKALKSLNSKIKPVAVKRKGAPHNSTVIDSANICSASLIRDLINKDDKSYINYINDSCKKTIEAINQPHVNAVFVKKIADIFNYLRTIKDENYFAGINECNIFLANKIMNLSNSLSSYEDIIAALKSKDNTYTRLSRLILCSVLEITQNDLELFSTQKPYVKLLGLRKSKSFVLKDCNKENIDIITKWSTYVNDNPDNKLVKKELSINDLYLGLADSTTREISKSVIVIE